MKLRLTVPFHADETPMSYVSRLAARNGVLARRFCSDFGLRFQDVVDGDPETLRAVAALGGIDPEPLIANDFRKSGDLCWIHRGHALHRSVLRREVITICPRCALVDIEANPTLRPHVAIYGRAAWLIDAVETCPIHRVRLISASKERGSHRLHDFAAHVMSIRSLSVAHATETQVREPGPLQTYALGRLAGDAASPLLDGMTLAAAVRLCETAGAVVIHGPHVDLKRLSDADRHFAGDRGYEEVSGGVGAFRALLDRLMDAVGPRDRLDGPQVAFGRFFTLLSVTRRDRDFDTARDIMRDYILENFAIETGRQLLGKPTEQRRIHSLHTLAREVGVHPKRLRKHLRAAGLVTDAQMAMSDHNVRIEAGPAADIAKALAATLSLAEAIDHLNAPRTQMDVLIKADFVRPQRHVAGFGAQDRYAVTALDEFLANLVAHPMPLRLDHSRFCNIPSAAKRGCCSASEVVRLILDGKLPTARSRTRGYMGILIDPKEVVKAVSGEAAPGLSLRVATREIGISDRVLNALIAHGHIASFIALNPVNRCPQTLVATSEIKIFKATYISLHALAKERKIYIGTLKSILDAAGILPVFDPNKVGATFYRRSVVNRKALSRT
jgi:hypothetical protein